MTGGRRAAVSERVIQKASEDSAFRQLLIADPNKALLDGFGVTVPEGLRVEVLEETSEHMYLILPPSSRELSDAELEGTSGGGCWCEVEIGLRGIFPCVEFCFSGSGGGHNH